MILYAKVATIRDKQLEEKRELYENKKTEEKRKDLMMELERLRKIKFFDEIEQFKREEQRKGHMVIIDQIKEREMQRLRAQEEKEREGQEMLKYARQLQQEEVETNLRKRHQQKLLLDEVYEANQKAIENKKLKAIQEKEEEDRIYRYNVEKARKEAEYLAEQQYPKEYICHHIRRIKDEKEREIQRLREKQEKFQDRQVNINN